MKHPVSASGSGIENRLPMASCHNCRPHLCYTGAPLAAPTHAMSFDVIESFNITQCFQKCSPFGSLPPDLPAAERAVASREASRVWPYVPRGPLVHHMKVPSSTCSLLHQHVLRSQHLMLSRLVSPCCPPIPHVALMTLEHFTPPNKLFPP
jgi:hypothetical protein